MSGAQPVSLEYGNNTGRRHRLDADHFVFGAMVGENAVLELAMWPDGVVRLLAPFPKDDIICEWSSLEELLFNEITRLNLLHDAQGTFIGKISDRLPVVARAYDL
jgi:hypothetical protein